MCFYVPMCVCFVCEPKSWAKQYDISETTRKRKKTIKIIYIIKFQPLYHSLCLMRICVFLVHTTGASRLGIICRVNRTFFLYGMARTSSLFFLSLLFSLREDDNPSYCSIYCYDPSLCVIATRNFIPLFMASLFRIRDFFCYPFFSFAPLRTVREFLIADTVTN